MLENICYTYDDGTMETVAEYTYTRDGQLHSIRDLKNHSTTVYEYDASGRFVGSYVYDETNFATDFSSSVEYDTDDGRICNTTYKWNYLSCDGEYNILSIYEYDYYQDGSISTLDISSGAVSMEIQYLYDYLKRLGTIEHNQAEGVDIRDEYLYYEVDGNATGLIEEYRNTVGNSTTTYNYTYDSKGNITKIVIGDKEIRYTYDDLGQLLSEENEIANRSFTYTYDNAGNIKSKKVCNLSTGVVASNQTYTYSSSAWGDMLTAFGSTGQIIYDEIGNPLTYNNGTTYHFTWDGRQLTKATIGNSNYTFTYSDEGIRTSKTLSSGSRIEYVLNGSQILAEITDSYVVSYIYDAKGTPIGMQHRLSSYAKGVWDVFWFERNLQGDIVAVYNSDGVKCISYIYDAWGKTLKTTTHNSTGTNAYASKNSFRYRGYYYDKDLGLYYLQSRYYDPNTCRFINADGQLNTDHILGTNLFAYCYNNPVMYVDPTGHAPDWNLLFMGALLVGIGALAVAAAFAAPVSCYLVVELAYLALAEAGALTAAIGASEVYESFTGNNPVKDDFGEQAYDALKYGSMAVVSMGATIIEVGAAISVCFVAGTMVKAAEGDIPIENIQVGDYVYAHNPETGETELKPVVNTFVNEATELVHVFTDGEEIICTNEHPFYSPVKGWTEACKLRAGDILVSLNGDYVVVEQVQHEILESPIKVYNFEVEDFHTYFVGDGDGVLVHNDCGWSSIVESSKAYNTVKHFDKQQTANYESTLTKLASGNTSGLNIHTLNNGMKAADLTGFGKGRGAGRIIYQVVDGVIEIFEVTIKHYKK